MAETAKNPPRQARVAYALLAVFPLGMHRAYLDDNRGAWAYRNCSLLAIAAWVIGRPVAFWILLGMLALFALYDIGWIGRRLRNLGTVAARDATES